MKQFVKRIIFDGVFYGYSILIGLYLLYRLCIFIGLTSEIAIETFEIKMTAIMTGAFLLMIICGLALSLVSKSGIGTLGDVLFASPVRRTELSAQGFWQSFWGIHLTLTFLFTIVVAIKVTEVSIYDLTDAAGFQGAIRLYKGLIHANLSLLPIAILQVINTIFIAFLATVLAIPIAFVMSFATAKNLMTHPMAFAVYVLLRTFLNVTRSVEPLIWAVIFTVWVGVGPFAGMLALFIHSISSLAKQYSEIIEEVDQGPIDGILSTGANKIQVIRFGIVPQISLQFIAYTIYRWDTNVRMATVIGLVGGGGIGTLLIKYQGQAMWPEVGCIILVIAAVVWIMDTASAYLREALK